MKYVSIAIEIIINMIEIALYIYLVNKKFPNKSKHKMPTIATFIISAFCLSFIGFSKISFPDYVISPVIILSYALIFRSGRVWNKVFWVIIGEIIICAIAICGISTGLLVPGVTDIEIKEYSFSIIRFEIQVICKIIQAILFILVANKKMFKNSNDHLNKNPVIILLIFLSVSSFFIILFFYYYGLKDLSVIANYLLIGGSLSILIINVVVYLLFESLSKQAEINLQIQTKLQQQEMIISYNKEISNLYEEMRIWIHDYHNHIQVILGYLQYEKYNKLIAYLEKIEMGFGNLKIFLDSGNQLIDSLVSSKILLAQNQNINIDVNIIIPNNLAISDDDLCVLFGNLLDNAIEACTRIEEIDSNRFIIFNTQVLKGHLHIMIKNSTIRVKKIGEKYVSSKVGKHHGIGLKRIDEIIELYGGYISRMNENNIFETNISIPMK